jgi:phage terminase large subunit
VHTAWDLGMDDSTSIWFFQMFGKEIRVVNYLENSGEGLPYYARELDRWAVLNDATYGKHYAPHDIAVREMGTGRSRLETARKLGIRFTKVKRMSVMDGIEAVRTILPQCWFSEATCHMGVEHLKSYHKEFDTSKNCFKKAPVHDASSHGADAMRTLACGLKQDKGTSAKDQRERNQYKEQEVSL